jgi:nickel-dependent lactate racemase
MNATLAYGQTGIEISLPESWQVTQVSPHHIAALASPKTALRTALRYPQGCPSLAELASSAKRVGIIINDITRATPTPLLVQAILDELSDIPDDRIVLFNALGTHRPNTSAELRQMLGNELVDRLRIVQNNAFDPATQLDLGVTRRGHPIWINRELAECDFRILTGFIEPHFFAGFSGGGKAIMPGMGGLATIIANHSPEMIAHPGSTWGVTTGNPIWEEITEISRRLGNTFLLNVTLNREQAITGIFAGDLEAAHAAGCGFTRQTSMVPVPGLFDIVITSNSGYPLDQNLYQAVKGMSAAAQITRPGGAILIAAECRDGIPAHGLYGRILREAGSPLRVLEMLAQPGVQMQDSWQVQIQAQIQTHAEVWVYSDRLSAEQIRSALLQPVQSFDATFHQLIDKFGLDARVCILPEGPQTIPYDLHP